MLRWHSFAEGGRERVTISFAWKYGQYRICSHLHRTAIFSTDDEGPKIIDTLLTIMFRMGQAVCLSCFQL
jgi:hypothetical protein